MRGDINRGKAAPHKSRRKYVDTTLQSAINQGTRCRITQIRKHFHGHLRDGHSAEENELI